jgi:hypothetical protein
MESPPDVTAEVPRAWARPAVSLPVLAFLALVGGQLPSFTSSANLYVIVLGGALVCLGLSGRLVPRRPVPDRPRPPAAWWLLPAVCFAVVEGATFLAGTRRYPTLSRLMDPLLEDEVIRSTFFFGWLAAFWVLVRR